MISINAIIFSYYMFCEVYRSHVTDGNHPDGIFPDRGFSGLVCALITLINIYVQFFFGTGLQTAAQVSTDTRLAIQDAGTLMKASRPEFGNPNSKSELHWG